MMEGQSRNSSNKKIGGNEILHSQTIKLVFNVYNFMLKEAKEGPCMIKQVQQQVSWVTSISCCSIQRILIEKRSVKLLVSIHHIKKQKQKNTQRRRAKQI